MPSATSNPLMLWTLVALLSAITLVVILPDVDLPDTAFRSNNSPLAIHTLCQQVPHHRNANAGVFLSFEPVFSSIEQWHVRETRGRHPKDLPIEHESLRC